MNATRNMPSRQGKLGFMDLPIGMFGFQTSVCLFLLMVRRNQTPNLPSSPHRHAPLNVPGVQRRYRLLRGVPSQFPTRRRLDRLY